MTIAPKGWGISDSSRDAQRYKRLLSALDHAVKEIRAMEMAGSIGGIDAVLNRLLPVVTETLNAEDAFAALLKEGEDGKRYLEITTAYPREDLRDCRLEYTQQFQKLIEDGMRQIIDPYWEEQQDIIAGLEVFDAASAVLVRMESADETRIVGVCNKRDPKSEVFLAADGMALDSIVELVAIGARMGERRRRELQGIQKTSAAISAELDLDELLPMIAERAADVFSAPATSLLLWDEAEEKLVIMASEGLSDEYVLQQHIAKEKVYAVAASNDRFRSFVTRDLRLEPFGQPDLYEKERLCTVLSMPLLVSGKLIGVLNIYSKNKPREFTLGEIELATIFANQAAIAISNAELFERTQRNLRQMEVLHQINAHISSALSLDGILQVALSEGLRAVGTDEGSIMLVNSTTNELEIKAWIVQGKFLAGKRHRKLALGEGIAGYVATTGEAYNCPDVSKDTYFVESFTKRSFRSLLSVPIVSHGRVLGTINTDSVEPHFFKEDDVQFLSALAGHVAITIESHRLSDIGMVLSTLALDEMLAEIVESACILTGTESSTIFLIDEKSGDPVRTVQFPSLKEVRDGARKKEGLTHLIIDSGEPIAVLDAQRDPRVRQSVKDEGVKSLMGVPLKVRVDHNDMPEVKTIGVLWVNTTQQRELSGRDVELLQSLAGQAAIAIQNAQLRRRVLEGLRATSDAIKATLDPDFLLGLITSKASEVFGAPATSLMLWDGVEENLVIMAREGLSDEYVLQQRIPKERVYTAAAPNGEFCPLVTPDLRLGSFGQPDLHEKEHLCTVLSTPLLVSDKLIGVLNIYSKDKPREFTPAEIELARIFANQAATAIEIAELYHQTKQRGEQLATLDQIISDIAKQYAEIQENARLREGLLKAGQGITALQELPAALQAVADSVREALACDVVTLYTYDQTNQEIGFPAVVSGELRSPDSLGELGYVSKESVVGQLLASGWLHFADDCVHDPLMSAGCFVQREGICSSAGIPLRVGDENVGILFVNYRTSHPFAPQERSAIELFATQAAIAIHNARLYETLREAQDELLASGAIAWMGLFGSEWSHTVAQKTYSIRNYVDILKDIAEDDNPLVEQALDSIDVIAQEIQDVPMTIPAPADTEKGEPIPIDSFVCGLLKRWCEPHEHVHLEFDLRCGDVLVRADETLLKMALQKLVDNAIRHMPKGGTLRVESLRTSKEFVTIALQDTSSGIPDEYKPFFGRRRIPRREGDSGSGMGALLARFILRKYGGDLELVWSEKGKGTRLEITLPLCE